MRLKVYENLWWSHTNQQTTPKQELLLAFLGQFLVSYVEPLCGLGTTF